MNSNTSAEFPTTLTEQPSIPLSLTRESQPPPVSPLAPMTQLPIPLPTLVTGEHESNQILMPSASPSPPKSETNSANPLSSLRSNVKPQELLERLPQEPRVLRVSKDDIKALSQVIMEFQEQFCAF